MTLIAGYRIQNYPILLNDLLVSGKNQSETVTLPTIGKTSIPQLQQQEYKPTGLYQKSIIIDKHLLLAWAGSRVVAKTLINELIDINRQSKLKINDINSFFQSPNDYDNEDVAIMGFLIEDDLGEGNIILKQFCFHCHCFKSEHFGPVMLGGSGTGEASKLLLSPDAVLNMDDTHPFESATISTLTYTGYLIQRELFDGITLTHNFGGFYELSTILNSEFIKYDDYVALFWKIDIVNDKDILLSLLKVIKPKYIGDTLYIRSIIFTSKGNLSSDKRATEVKYYDELHIVNSIINTQSETIQDPPPLESKYCCNYFIYKSRDENTVLAKITEYNNHDLVYINDNESDFNISFTGELINRLKKDVFLE